MLTLVLKEIHFHNSSLKMTFESVNLFLIIYKLYQSNPSNASFPSMLLLFVNKKLLSYLLEVTY